MKEEVIRRTLRSEGISSSEEHLLASAVQDAHGDERRARAILPFPASHCASASDFRFKYEQAQFAKWPSQKQNIKANSSAKCCTCAKGGKF